MSKITIENINGKQYTVVWHDGGDPCYWLPSSQGLMGYGADFEKSQPEGLICTALPALPRHPKPEDAPLLYRYMAEGIFPTFAYWDDEKYIWPQNTAELHISECIVQGWEITHATHNGERVEVAITDEASDD